VSFKIARESPDQDEVRAMIRWLDAYMSALYPPESNHFLDMAALLKPNVRFFVAREGARGVGCGALVVQGAGGAFYGEVKRMYVDPPLRGRGLGRLILDALEAEARAVGLACLRLETGPKQPEALGLYRRAGFAECGPFGDYAPDPLSVFMEKPLV
jgi:putative acetyltransferase